MRMEVAHASPCDDERMTAESCDAIVLAGEIYALMDDGETLMRAGDVLIQRGTNHAWANRSDAPARIAFILIDSAP